MERLQYTLKTQEEQHHAPMDKAQNKLTGMLEDYGKITGLSFFHGEKTTMILLGLISVPWLSAGMDDGAA
jgi:hypothetical protein